MIITFSELKSVDGELYGYIVNDYFEMLSCDEIKVKEKLRKVFPSIELSYWSGSIHFSFHDKADTAYFQLFLNDALEID